MHSSKRIGAVVALLLARHVLAPADYDVVVYGGTSAGAMTENDLLQKGLMPEPVEWAPTPLIRIMCSALSHGMATCSRSTRCKTLDRAAGSR